MKLLLSTAYFAPVQYFCVAASCRQIFVEAHEHYLKQTYRTRCEILGANGVLPLVVPVEKAHGEKMPIRDVRVDYTLPWQRAHWRSLVSAYSSSPFFVHYADEIAPVFERRETFLLDLNMSITRLMCSLMGIGTEISLTDAYQAAAGDALDFRRSISPKSAHRQCGSAFVATEYYQVFSQKFGFVPNLSILDLLFNEGPEALAIVRKDARGFCGEP
ncbi:MAG: WbqC family protein [Prevotellaceae bacterium]|nr:WbqC family protein [Prevotellaceae bacterium]